MKLFFSRGETPLRLRLVFFIILSILLIVLDYHHHLPTLRHVLNNAVLPLQYLVDTPLRIMNSINQSLLTREKLQADNATLRSQQVLLQAKLQRLNTLQEDNRQLNQVLAAAEHFKRERLELARLLRVQADPLLNEVVLNKGKINGVYVGQAVIDANGVVGQVIDVDSVSSRVLLVTDFRSDIPVQDLRSDVRGILVGRGRLAKLLLRDVPATVDIKVNDLLVTSGLGGHYPPGYPVGIVSSVNINAAAPFASIQVDPSAQLDQNRPVLLIWPEKGPGTTFKKKITSANTLKNR